MICLYLYLQIIAYVNKLHSIFPCDTLSALRISPFTIIFFLMNGGLALVSSMILPMYSPRMPKPRMVAEPKKSDTNSMVVTPLGTDYGKNIRIKTVTSAKNTAPAKLKPPKAVKRCNGRRLKEKIAFFAQPIFLIQLLVLLPNIRSGRT